VSLSRHADTRRGALRSIEARIAREPGGALTVTYILQGDLAQVRVPAPRLPRPGDRLWEHTCCEIFIACAGSAAYHEFNLAPSGEWAAYAFTRYREGGTAADPSLDPRVSVRASAGKLELDAVLRLDRLSPRHAAAALQLGLSAVVEESDGTLGYWALKHPAGKPDFHHPDSFALELDEVRD
jgi:hypothetical protein